MHCLRQCLVAPVPKLLASFKEGFWFCHANRYLVLWAGFNSPDCIPYAMNGRLAAWKSRFIWCQVGGYHRKTQRETYLWSSLSLLYLLETAVVTWSLHYPSQHSASFTPAVILPMPCKHSSGCSSPASVGRDLSFRPGTGTWRDSDPQIKHTGQVC